MGPTYLVESNLSARKLISSWVSGISRSTGGNVCFDPECDNVVTMDPRSSEPRCWANNEYSTLSGWESDFWLSLEVPEVAWCSDSTDERWIEKGLTVSQLMQDWVSAMLLITSDAVVCFGWECVEFSPEYSRFPSFVDKYGLVIRELFCPSLSRSPLLLPLDEVVLWVVVVFWDSGSFLPNVGISCESAISASVKFWSKTSRISGEVCKLIGELTDNEGCVESDAAFAYADVSMLAWKGMATWMLLIRMGLISAPPSKLSSISSFSNPSPCEREVLLTWRILAPSLRRLVASSDDELLLSISLATLKVRFRLEVLIGSESEELSILSVLLICLWGSSPCLLLPFSQCSIAMWFAFTLGSCNSNNSQRKLQQ